MTTSRRSAAESDSGRRDAGPAAPDPRPPEEDLRELQDPYGLPFPGRDDGWPLRRPEYVIVIDQIRGTGQPFSLAELLEHMAARTPESEADLEAEP